MKPQNSTSFFFQFFTAAVLAIFAACVNPPDYPIEPVIEYAGITKDTLRRGLFKDTTQISFTFTDGDGDLGDTMKTLYIFDSRLGSTSQLEIPTVLELGANAGISGTITFNYFSSCCVFPPDLGLLGCKDEWDGLPYDQVSLQIFIEDRAGNQSNTIATDPIFFECFD